MAPQWTIQEAESRLSEVIKAARAGQPQYLFQDEHEQAVLVSPETWKLVSSRKPSFKEALMSIPAGDPFLDEESRSELKLRDVEL